MAKRILHVVGGMKRGGIETWLMHILRHIDRDRFQMDFMVHTTQPCAYDDEIRSLGSQIIPCLHSSQPWQYASNFQRILREFGPYDIIHSHVHHFSGYVLRLAQQAGIPTRIAHSHLDSSALENKKRLDRRLYLALTKSWIARHATLGLGCSQLANADLFGANWRSDPRWQLLYYGIDLTPFQGPINTFDTRTELGIPADAFLVGHVGRFQEQKNHRFLLEIFTEVLKREPHSYLLVVGEGPLRSSVEQKASQMGLRDRIIFAGSRSDVPRLMLGSIDVFLFPSLCEGLPLVLIEAQVAGLPCVLSDVITEEVDLVHPLMKRVSLLHPPSTWAKLILEVRDIKSRINEEKSFSIFEKSSFNIVNCLMDLTNIYESEYQKKDCLTS